MRDFVFAKNPDWVVTPEHFVGPVPPGGELTSEEVSPGVFAALGATLVAGREFTDRDMGGPASAVINESFANRYFPGVNATGKRFKEGGPDSRPRWITVIGVVRDLHRGGLERPTLPEYYSLWIPSTVDIVLRTRGDPETVARSVRAAARSIQPLAAIARIVPLEDEFGATGAQRRMQTSLLVAFAVLALLMAAIGIYGVMNYVVSGRTQEIGVRMALGARVTDALSLVIGDGMRLAFTGVAIGVAGALGLTGLMTHLVFGIGARDPISIAAGALVLLAVSFIACYVPARRAARIDPVIALREQ